MKKYRRLEARKRVDELHNQMQVEAINHQILVLNQQLETLEKEFSSLSHSSQNVDTPQDKEMLALS